MDVCKLSGMQTSLFESVMKFNNHFFRRLGGFSIYGTFVLFFVTTACARRTRSWASDADKTAAKNGGLSLKRDFFNCLNSIHSKLIILWQWVVKHFCKVIGVGFDRLVYGTFILILFYVTRASAAGRASGSAGASAETAANDWCLSFKRKFFDCLNSSHSRYVFSVCYVFDYIRVPSK